MHVFMYVFMHRCMYNCAPTCVCVCVRACMYVVSMYVCIHNQASLCIPSIYPVSGILWSLRSTMTSHPSFHFSYSYYYPSILSSFSSSISPLLCHLVSRFTAISQTALQRDLALLLISLCTFFVYLIFVYLDHELR